MPVTNRHKLAGQNIRKYPSRKQAMLAANYSKSYAESSHIKRTKGWQEMMEKSLPDSLVIKKHREMLNKREVVRTFNHDTGEWDSALTSQPHSDVNKALDMAYKLKGRYAESDNPNINIGLFLTDVQVERIIKNRKGSSPQGTDRNQ